MPVILNACDFKLRGRNENGNISVDMQDETEKKPLLSTAVARFLQHRLLELVGLCLFVIGCLIMAALASAHSGDPSWSTASNAIIRNWLGPIGANLSSGLLSAIGLASFALAAIPIL